MLFDFYLYSYKLIFCAKERSFTEIFRIKLSLYIKIISILNRINLWKYIAKRYKIEEECNLFSILISIETHFVVMCR